MPVYEYRCEACGEKHEALQKMSDDPLVDCPACGKPALRRVISPTAFVLKGSGWYRDHYGLKSGGGKGDAGGSGKGGSAGTGGEKKAASSGSGGSGSKGD